MDKHHRRHERIPYNEKIVINDSLTVKAIGISEGGLYVITGNNFSPREMVKVSLPYKNEKIEVKARVKHAHKGVGLGLVFIDLDNALKAKIKELIEDIKK